MAAAIAVARTERKWDMVFSRNKDRGGRQYYDKYACLSQKQGSRRQLGATLKKFNLPQRLA
jgi:hypothetical protein